MKQIFLLIVAILLLVCSSRSILAQTVTVTGAGSSAVDGSYTPSSPYTFNGKNCYAGGSYRIYWETAYSPAAWKIATGGGNGYYLNTANTTLPPATGWQVDNTYGPGGNLPAPTLSGDGLVAPAGSGTSGNPHLIANLSDLYWITQTDSSWGDFFKQTADIDASSTSSWASGAGFSPIGNSTTNFTGTYHGGGHKITGLFINLPSTNCVGLFGYAGSGSVIDSLGVENTTVFGVNSVGGFAGTISGTVRSCHSTGTVTGGYSVGGFAGQLSSGTVSNSYSTVTTNAKYDAGGFAGDNVSGGSIDSCYATGNVIEATDNSTWVCGGLVGWNANGSSINTGFATGNATGYTGIGGLVGSDNGSITNSYALGNATGTQNVGGLIGGGSGSAVVTNSYSAGNTSGSTDIDALIGNLNGTSANNCFFNCDSASGGVAGTGLTTAQMQTNTTFLTAGWSGSVWNIDAGTNYGFPYLRWQNPGGTQLPVELTSFTASVSNLTTVLAWKTATEVNNAGFDIERKPLSNPPLTGEGTKGWGRVGSVAGAGTSNAPHNYSYADNVGTAGTYSYRLKQIDHNGAFTYSQEVQVQVGAAPKVFGLAQNYPNPFNPTTTMQFTVPNDGRATLMVYNTLGQEVATLFDGVTTAGGYHQATFDGSRFASGIYFARLQFGGETLVKKLLMTK